jgi:DNA-directed RNA polymerase specialized sigma24 family protein
MKDDDIEGRAAHWLVEQQDLEFSDEQRSEFNTWLSDDARHREAYEALARAWHRTDALKTLRPREALHRKLTRQIQCSRDMDLQKADRLAKGALSIVLTPGGDVRSTSILSSETAPRENPCLVATNVARDWFNDTCRTRTYWVWAADGQFQANCAGSIQSHLPLDTLTWREIPTQASVAKEFKRIVGRAVERLPHHARCAITLFKAYHYTADEIAGSLSITLDAVSGHLEHAAYYVLLQAISQLSPEEQVVFFAPLSTQSASQCAAWNGAQRWTREVSGDCVD